MKPTMSAQTKSFVILFGIGLAGCVISLLISSSVFNRPIGNGDYTVTNYQDIGALGATPKRPTSEAIPDVDTTSWTTYRDPQYHVSFKYPSKWKVKKVDNKIDKDFYTLEVSSEKKYDTSKIYISPKSYFALNGLPVEVMSIGGMQGITADHILFGVQKDNVYYTFDLGTSLELRPEFNALVKSVSFQ